MTKQKFFELYRQAAEKRRFLVDAEDRIRQEGTGCCPICAVEREVNPHSNLVANFGEAARKIGLDPYFARCVAIAADRGDDTNQLRHKLLS